MSPRTAKYVEAMVREGDNFDYGEWLKKVRAEEALANQVPTAITCRDDVASQAQKLNNASYSRDAKPSLVPALISKPNSRALRRPLRQPKSQTPQARLRRWLEKIHRASGKFQGSRERDAVYEYLAAVFTIVMHYRVRRRTTKLLRHASKFGNVSVDNNADPFSAVIRCTCGNTVDAKTISKWSRGLRYAARRKEPDMRLKTFMKEAGGVNACAARYARYYGSQTLRA